MNVNDRVKLIRKELNLTQKEFGSEIAVAQSYLTNIENGLRPVTDKIVKLICTIFNVNENWLRNGELPMFLPTVDDELKQLALKYKFNDFEYKFLYEYLKLDLEKRADVAEFLENILNSDASFLAATERNIEKDNEKIDKEVEAYRQELEAESKGATLSVSEKREGA